MRRPFSRQEIMLTQAGVVTVNMYLREWFKGVPYLGREVNGSCRRVERWG